MIENKFYNDFTFDVGENSNVVLRATQGDTNSRGLKITLVIDGVAVTDLSDYTMRFFAVKPDETRVFTEAVAVGGKFVVEHSNQTFASIGVLVCSLVLYDLNGAKIAGKEFKMVVKSSFEDDSVLSTDERGILDRAFELATDIVPRLETLDVATLEGIEGEYEVLISHMNQATNDMLIATGDAITDMLGVKSDTITATTNAITATGQANTATGNAITATSQAVDKIGEITTKITDVTNLESAVTNAEALRVTAELSREEAEALREESHEAFINLSDRVDAIITTPVEGVSAQEIIDARQGALSVGANITEVKSQLAQNKTQQFYSESSQHRQRKPIMTIVNDDGRSEVWTKLKPIVEDLQVPVTSCLITSMMGTSETWLTIEQIQQLKATGLFEQVSHTHTHPSLAELTEEEVREEFRLSKEWLIAQGLDDDLLVYPYGSHNITTRQVAREFYRAAVDIDNGNSFVNYPPFTTYKLERVYMEGKVATVKQKIDEAIANNGWIIMGMHVQYATWLESEFREVVNYAKNAGIDIVTLKEGLNLMGNILDVGDTTNMNIDDNAYAIDCDGKIYGSALGKIVSKLNGYYWTVTNDTLPSDFEKGKITMVNITTSYAVGFPKNAAGTLHTYRLSTASDGYTYQEYWIVSSNLRYLRYFNKSTNLWDSWFLVAPSMSIEKLLDFGEVGAGKVVERIVSFIGATNDDQVICSPRSSITDGIMWSASIGGTDSVRIRVYNTTASPISLTRIFKITILKQ